VLRQRVDLRRNLLLSRRLRLGLLCSRAGRRRGRNGHRRATWHGLNDRLRRRRCVLPDYGYAADNDCCRRDAKPGARDEVASSNDRFHVFFSWRTAIRLGRLLAC